jgi:hypothetical protein
VLPSFPQKQAGTRVANTAARFSLLDLENQIPISRDMLPTSNPSISRISRKLWPLPILVIPGLLGLCFFASGLLGF